MLRVLCGQELGRRRRLYHLRRYRVASSQGMHCMLSRRRSHALLKAFEEQQIHRATSSRPAKACIVHQPKAGVDEAAKENSAPFRTWHRALSASATVQTQKIHHHLAIQMQVCSHSQICSPEARRYDWSMRKHSTAVYRARSQDSKE